MPGAETRRPTNHRSGTEKYSVISKPPSQRGVVIRCSTGLRAQPEGGGGGRVGFGDAARVVAAGVVRAAAPVCWPDVFTDLTMPESDPQPAKMRAARTAAAVSTRGVTASRWRLAPAVHEQAARDADEEQHEQHDGLGALRHECGVLKHGQRLAPISGSAAGCRWAQRKDTARRVTPRLPGRFTRRWRAS